MKKKFRYLVAIGVVALLMWGWQFVPQAAASNQTQAIHTISRLSYGATPKQIAKVQKAGIESYIQAQLNPDSISETALLNNKLKKLPSAIANDSVATWRKYRQYDRRINAKGENTPTTEARKRLEKERNQLRNQLVREAKQAHIARAVFSSRQLQEVMTDFWFNHFNVYASKRAVGIWVNDYESQLRKHSLGNFRDLLGVTAHHPAMLMYLDNDLNTNPNSKSKQGNARGLNENYARELMELHTLGVDGGYTQQDVIALARIFTGWGINYNPEPQDTSAFRFFERRHDNGEKTFLGQKIPGNGIAEGEKALDILASHSSTARFVSYKLAQYFVSDRPPESLVNVLAQTFTASDGNIKTVLDTLFHSTEFNDPQYYQAKFKTPLQYVVSLVRASNIRDFKLERLENILSSLGMPVYSCVTPDGYKNTETAWLNPDTMLRRLSFAVNIANGGLNKSQKPSWQQLQQTLGSKLTNKTKKAIAPQPNHLKSALILGSPEMMYR